jgi:hypothetical protein
MATEEDVMNETVSRTVVDVVMQAVYEMSGDYLDVITVDMISEGNYRNTLTWTTDHILAALANAGYVVVDRERWERVLGFAVTHDDEYCKAWGDCLQPGDLDE